MELRRPLMQVVLVSHYYPAHRGGIELVAGELAARLAARHGIRLEWHASDCDSAPVLPGVRCVPARTCNLIERRLGVPYPLWSPAALRRLAGAVRKADAVHLHDCLYLPNVVASLAARLARRPVLVTQHIGMVPYRNPILRVLMVSAYRSLGRVVLGSAGRVAFVSDVVRSYFDRFVQFRAPPVLLPNGVDTRIFHPAEPAARAGIREELGVASGQPLLLFVGRFVEKKGLLLLRELASALPGARWVFAGWGPLDPQGWQCANVAVARERSGASLASLYQAADLLVLPSRGEGFPLVVQEAMACGTPAIVSAETAAGCPGAAGLLLAEALDPAPAAPRWTARLRELLGSAGPLAALRPRVAEYARETWSWERCAARYAELLEALCTRR
jgi:phosphatidylinositol alpha-1,6-mannosyltransferase